MRRIQPIDAQRRTHESVRGHRSPHSLPGRSAPSREHAGGDVERLKAKAVWSTPLAQVHPRLLRSRSESSGQWLEVAYDLVYAVAFSELSSTAADDPTWNGMARLALVMTPFWLSWVSYAAVLTRFDVDDLGQRLLTFVQMFGVILMVASASIADAHAPGELFAVGYLLNRASLIGMYIRIHRAVPSTKTIVRFYIVAFSLGAAVWCASLWIHGPTQYVFWIAGTLVDLVAPWLGRAQLKSFPLNADRVQERLGILISVIIGAALEFVVTGMKTGGLRAAAVVNGALAFGYTIASWWIYIGFIYNPRVRSQVSSGQPLIYSHLPLVLGLLIMSSGLSRAVREAGGAPHSEIEVTVLMVDGGTALWLASIAGIKSFVLDMFLRRPMVVMAAAAVVAGASAVFETHLPLWLSLTVGFAIVCMTIVGRVFATKNRLVAV